MVIRSFVKNSIKYNKKRTWFKFPSIKQEIANLSNVSDDFNIEYFNCKQIFAVCASLILQKKRSENRLFSKRAGCVVRTFTYTTWVNINMKWFHSTCLDDLIKKRHRICFHTINWSNKNVNLNTKLTFFYYYQQPVMALLMDRYK